jgi:DUF1009 family protein
MGDKLGIIAGSGKIPFFLYQEAKKKGYECVVAGIRGETEVGLQESTPVFEWFDFDRVLDIVAFFQREEIRHVLLGGKIDPLRIYKRDNLNPTVLNLLEQSADKSPTSLILLAIDFFTQKGISIEDPTRFFASVFLDEGVLTDSKPSAEIEADIRFGWKKARDLADSDIGQTLVVKDRAVVAVEGMEGTNKAIRRAGQLAGPGCVVLKLSRTRQDPRIDLPAVGLSTVESLIEAQCAALCIEAHRVAFFEKEESVKKADTHRVALVVRKS